MTPIAFDDVCTEVERPDFFGKISNWLTRHSEARATAPRAVTRRSPGRKNLGSVMGNPLLNSECDNWLRWTSRV